MVPSMPGNRTFKAEAVMAAQKKHRNWLKFRRRQSAQTVQAAPRRTIEPM
jgi:hypothetical protein